MTAAFKRLAAIAAVFCLAAAAAFAQDGQAAKGPAFTMSLGIGVQTFNDPGGPVTYQYVSLLPGFTDGKLAVGLALALDYNFSGGSGNSFAVRQADWQPTGAVTLQSVAAIYLPKIAYVRWGEKGDPVFARLGSFDDATLGDGFIMGAYNNTLFLPTERHLGLQADAMLDSPGLGVQSVIGNLAAFDVMAGRIFVRPFAGASSAVLSGFQVGATAAVDTSPYFETLSGETSTASAIGVFGADIMVPLLATQDGYSLAAFTDAATIQGTTWGTMIGVGGRLITVLTYGAQLRFLGQGFTPTYFGPTYDVLRDQQYQAVQAASSAFSTFGWLVSFGTSLLDDRVIFKLSLDGPFVTTETDPLLSEVHLNGILSMVPGVLSGFSCNIVYDKKAIGSFGDLASAQNEAIQGQLRFQSGPATVAFVYILTYDPRQPLPDQWTVSSGLQSSIALF